MKIYWENDHKGNKSNKFEYIDNIVWKSREKVRNFIYQNTNTQSGTGGIKMQKN